MRKVTAARLSESKATIPHYYPQQSIAMDNVNKLRKSLNTIANGAYRISVNDFMIMVATPALRDVPEINRLMPEESQGCSFTISNLGMYGISSLSAIINPLHAAILSVGVTEQKLVLDESSEKGFKTADVMSVQLSADHRVVDGATGALFLKAFKGYLENPLTLIL
ncbi:pyruvate dehydrogenase complex dihydrolipoamide acetyltransferase component (E2) [Linderina macrospora]|uniref:Pyruvate dehydrogenase complex dihydrolipoamide acetyltransferase component (E2) n=1 Tax=Linderina macrospora TaxID=4868 RepID=A0ACC1JC58_9FUNG|nr:pyruvate dehydrogenase complex dihydrolipoamide acetyltransferase component (E2) [Linderina macrospora]